MIFHKPIKPREEVKNTSGIHIASGDESNEPWVHDEAAEKENVDITMLEPSKQKAMNIKVTAYSGQLMKLIKNY